jgi:hypothetical protein
MIVTSGDRAYSIVIVRERILFLQVSAMCLHVLQSVRLSDIQQLNVYSTYMC